MRKSNWSLQILKACPRRRGTGGDFVVINVNPLTLVSDAIVSRGVETVSIKTTLDIDDFVVHHPNSNSLLPSVGELADDDVAGFQVW